MLVAEQVREFLEGPVVDEMHALLWTKPKVNRGEYDGGWSCREHAASIAALLTLVGLDVYLRHGRCMFLQGETANARPIGLGQESSGRAGHSWAWIKDFGDLDVSPRLHQREPAAWRPVDASYGIVADAWPVRGLKTDVVVCDTTLDYDNAIAVGTHMRDEGRAVYWVGREELFSPAMLIDGVRYLNSPLTARVAQLAGPQVYLKLVVHLRGLAAGARHSLRTISSGNAWRAIGQISDSEATELVEDLSRAIER